MPQNGATVRGRLADVIDHVVPVLLTIEDFHFDAQEPNGDIGEGGAWVAHGIFFGGDDHVDIAFETTLGEGGDLTPREAVVVGKAFFDFELSTEFDQGFLEIFGHRNTGEGGNVFVLEEIERLLLEGREVFQILRAVRGRDDRGRGIVATNLFDEIGVIAAVGLGENDVVRAAQVFLGLAQSSCGEHRARAERGIGIDQANVEGARHAQVLHAVIEDQGIGAEFLDGKPSGFDAIFIDENGHAGEIVGEHEWFIAGEIGVEQDGSPGGDNFGQLLGLGRCFLLGFPFLWFVECLAFVAAGEDCDAAMAFAQGAR